MSLRYDEIAEILKIIDQSSCDELIIETDDLKLVVRRKNASEAVNTIVPTATREPISPPPPAAPTRASAASKQSDKAPHQIEVSAPMVGTFYRAPAPGAPPFIEKGSTVRKGDPLCLIEVMKLFTTITSEHDGRIALISAEDGELVEFGRTLFLIEPA